MRWKEQRRPQVPSGRLTAGRSAFSGMEDSKCSMLRVDRCGRLRTRRKPWAGRGTKTGSSFSLEPGVGSLGRVPSTGGEPVAATELQPLQRGHTFPTFLPDGRRFLYYVLGPSETRGVYVGELDRPAFAKRLLDADAAAGFSPPNRVLFVRRDTLSPRKSISRTESGCGRRACRCRRAGGIR